MIRHISSNLDLIQLPRQVEIGDYDWFDIELQGVQVGKARCRIEASQLTIFTIMIYPEFEHNGFARSVIEAFQARYLVIYADRVRFRARNFWVKQGFSEESADLFVWHRA